MATDDVEFWPIAKVMDRVGLSRSEIYRRAREGSFPPSRQYRNSTRVYWLSTDVRRWQSDEIAGVDVGELIG